MAVNGKALEQAMGTGRSGAFRAQLNAIVLATPKSLKQDENWQGRGDG